MSNQVLNSGQAPNDLGSSSGLAGCLMTIVSGAFAGSQLCMLGYGYELRELWYVDDIDR